MKITNQRKGNTLIVKMEGELDHHSAESVRIQIDSWLEDPTVSNLIMDLQGLSFMDSSGIGVFIGRYKIITQRNGEVVLVRLNSQIKRIIEVSGLLKIFRVYSDIKEAFDDILGVK